MRSLETWDQDLTMQENGWGAKFLHNLILYNNKGLNPSDNSETLFKELEMDARGN